MRLGGEVGVVEGRPASDTWQVPGKRQGVLLLCPPAHWRDPDLRKARGKRRESLLGMQCPSCMGLRLTLGSEGTAKSACTLITFGKLNPGHRSGSSLCPSVLR